MKILLLVVIGATLVQSLVYPEFPINLDNLDLSKAPPNDEQRLLRHIMRSYDRAVRPVYQASSVVSIAVGMTLAHIFNVDEKKQVLSMNIWLEQEWQDERIRWEPVEFGNITQLTVPTKFIWTPDIVLYNNAEDFSQGIAQTNVAIYPSGSVLWAPPVKYHSTCKLDVSFFPFDDQICFLHFGSWIYDGSQVDVTNRSDKITIQKDSFTPNGEWEIVATKVTRKVTRYQNSNRSGYPGLRFTLHLRRRTLFYLYNIIIPCIMLSVLTMMQFWLPCESGEKVTLGLTVLLAYSVFSFNIAENMPETSEVIPLVAIYLMCIMGISAVSVTLSVIVLNMRHGGERKHAVPIWLQYFAYDVLGPIVCWRSEKYNRHDQWPQNITFQQAFNSLSNQLARHDVPPVTVTHPSPQVEISTVSPLRSIMRRDPSPMIELCSLTRASSLGNGDLMSFSAQQGVPPNSDPLHRRKEMSESKVYVKTDAPMETMPLTVPPGTTEVNGKSRRHRSVKTDIMRRAGKLMDRIESEQRIDEMLHEWRKVSRIFDQFFFGLILFFTGTVTIVLLLVAPRFSKRTLLEDLDFGNMK